MSKALDILKPLFGPVLVAAVLIGYDQFVRVHPAPPEPALVAAAKAYSKTLPDAFGIAGAQVKAGVLTDKAGIIKGLQEHAKPLAKAMDDAFAPLVDDKGKITNAPAAADLLAQVSRALGGK